MKVHGAPTCQCFPQKSVLDAPESEGEKCHKSKYFREILPNLTPGYLFMLGWSAASKITYVRPVGDPEKTSNIGENPNINHLT